MALIATCALGMPSVAEAAAQRFAASDGNGPEPCLEADPCSLLQAVAGPSGNGSGVNGGDEVIVLSGTYTETNQIFAFDNITIHGQAGQPRPVINSNISTAMGTNVGATFRRLQIEHTGAISAITVFPGTLDDLVVHSTAAAACAMSSSSTITNSVCWTQASSNSALLAGGGFSGDTIVMRNVTVVSTGASNTDALRVSNGGGSTTTVTATNVIAQATNDPPEDPGISDIEASADGAGSTTVVTLDHSNYDDFRQLSTNGGAATITPNTTNGNQGAVPLLANPATGDFHQLLGSPTIDAGIVDPANGSTDMDGQPRQIGTSTDIGADEFPDADSDGIPDSSDGCPNEPGPASNNGCPVPDEPQTGDTTPPDTAITGGPSAKTKKKTATFAFSGSDARAVASFQCKLDLGSFESCTSPKTYSGLKKGSHTLSVRAVDAAGNVDPTPATRTWEVKKKKKKKKT